MENRKNPRQPELCFKKVSILNLQYKLAKQPFDILIIRKKASADTRIERICVAAPKQWETIKFFEKQTRHRLHLKA